MYFKELIQLLCWFLPLPKSEIPGRQNEFSLKRKASMTAEQFLQSSIQTSFHMVGGFWYGWVCHKAK